MPLGVGHMFAIAPDPGVIGTQDDPLQLVVLDGLLQNGIEEGSPLPRRAGEDLVVCRPILLGIAVETDGASQGALTDATEDAKGQGEGPIQTALLREDPGPVSGVFKQVVQEVHKEVVGSEVGAPPSKWICGAGGVGGN